MRDTAMICAVMISDCTLNKAMQVEIRLAAAISSTVMNKNTPDDARALAAAVSNNPIDHLETHRSPRTGCGKTDQRRKLTSGAKARTQFPRLTARLKSCPSQT